MKNSDSHVYLYAKHHYQRDPDIFMDLCKIYSIRNGIGLEYINNRDALSCLLSLVAEHMKNDKEGMSFDRHFLEFISDIDPKNTWKVGYRPKPSFNQDQNPLTAEKEYDFEYAVAYKCLSVLSLTKVSDIPEGLDEADPKVLPLSTEWK